MTRKLFPVFVILTILAMVLAACGGQKATPTPAASGDTGAAAQPVVQTVEVVKTVVVTVEVPAESAEQPAAPPLPTGYGTVVQRIKDRGKVICGGRTDLAGFGVLDANGRNTGFDVDLCRAVAAALLDDPEAVEVVAVSAAERGPALQTGEVDILSRNTTWTSSRDAQWGNFTWIWFYDGQGFMVPAASGITTIEELDGATICVTSGTTTELNLADAFRQRGLEFTPVTFEDTATVYGTYEEGRCDAATSDKSQLASVRSGFQDPTAHTILDVTISKEPLTPAVPSGDDQWLDIVKVVIWGLMNAEELDVTQANVIDMESSANIEVRRLLGSEGEWGQADLGLPADAIAKAVQAVGNYGEIYDRYIGPSGLNIPRGPNSLWTEGGLIYAPPLR
jgi:general L-amino acid transport system substrate-binding protein